MPCPEAGPAPALEGGRHRLQLTVPGLPLSPSQPPPLLPPWLSVGGGSEGEAVGAAVAGTAAAVAEVEEVAVAAGAGLGVAGAVLDAAAVAGVAVAAAAAVGVAGAAGAAGLPWEGTAEDPEPAGVVASRVVLWVGGVG